MKKTYIMLIIAVSLFSGNMCQAQSIKKYVIANGGQVISDNDTNAGVTIGQSFSGVIMNPTQTATVGFWYSSLDLVSSLELVTVDIEGDDYTLSQNYPNPFTTDTRFDLNLPKRSNIEMSIFDQKGILVNVLAKETLSGGKYTILWEAAALPSGSYFCILRLENGSTIRLNGIIKMSIN
jgi:hypothetical protein